VINKIDSRKVLEAGTIAHFGKEARTAFIFADAKTLKATVDSYVKLFQVLR
jgi:hypothetical protein